MGLYAECLAALEFFVSVVVLSLRSVRTENQVVCDVDVYW